MRRAIRPVAVAACLVSAVFARPLPAAAALSDPSSGPSGLAALSADGRYVAFISSADNLLDGDATKDTNGHDDAFVLDTQTGVIDLVSRTAAAEANGDTTEVDISSDGNTVAFVSEATNLIGSDANGAVSDVFVVDRSSGGVQLVSRRGAGGVQGAAASWNVSISNDGTKVAFTSYSSNLIGTDTNNAPDAFVRDLVALTTTRVSTDSNGKQANAGTQYVGISGNGAVVGFAATASNLITGDSNGRRDVFVKILATGKTARVSVTNGEKQAKGDSTFYSLSNTGRWVGFTSTAANLVSGDDNALTDAFVRDRTGATTTRVSRKGSTDANGESYGVAVSPDGAYVAFTTIATNLGGGADANGTLADVYEFDLATKTLALVSVVSGTQQGNEASFDPAYGSAGVLGFTSRASDLVAGDTDGVGDVFTRTFGLSRSAGTTVLRSCPAPTS
jgi:hypothetical protein